MGLFDAKLNVADAQEIIHWHDSPGSNHGESMELMCLDKKKLEMSALEDTTEYFYFWNETVGKATHIFNMSWISLITEWIDIILMYIVILIYYVILK